MPAEQIEALFGRDAVLAPKQDASINKELEGHWSQPLEMLPGLLVLVLVFLAVEALIANKFYKKEPAPDESAARG